MAIVEVMFTRANREGEGGNALFDRLQDCCLGYFINSPTYVENIVANEHTIKNRIILFRKGSGDVRNRYDSG